MKWKDKKIIHHTVKDYKDEQGKWVGYVNINCPENRIIITTTAQQKWHHINMRCGERYQKKFPTYAGVTNGFVDFQEFAEWCQTSKGYLNVDEKGNTWTLDKDILFPFLKTYSPATCAFIPEYINNLFVMAGRFRGEYPLGVNKAGVRGLEPDVTLSKVGKTSVTF